MNRSDKSAPTPERKERVQRKANPMRTGPKPKYGVAMIGTTVYLAPHHYKAAEKLASEMGVDRGEAIRVLIDRGAALSQVKGIA
jgi:hypothetical protein